MKNLDENIYKLDKTDKAIVELLMEGSKTSLVHISKKVGISTTAVHQRIKKLESAGVIENTISFLNPRKIGYKVTTYVGIDLDRPGHYQEMVKILSEINEVVEAHYTTGNYTVFVKVLAKDNDHLMKILSSIQKIKGVTRTETFISLEQSISRQLKL